MKKMTLEQVAGRPEQLFEIAQRERILVTRKGKPLALVTGVGNLDDEELGYVADPAFWSMIAARRREPRVPFEKIKTRLVVDERQAAQRKEKAKKGKRNAAS
jgi:hypothetical protein